MYTVYLSSGEYSAVIDALECLMREHLHSIFDYEEYGDFPDIYCSLDEAIQCHENGYDLCSSLRARLIAFADELTLLEEE